MRLTTNTSTRTNGQDPLSNLEPPDKALHSDRLTEIALRAFLENYFARHPECQSIHLEAFCNKLQQLPDDPDAEYAHALLSELFPENIESWRALFAEEELALFVLESVTIDKHSPVKLCGWLSQLEEFEKRFVTAVITDHSVVLPHVQRPQIKTYREKFHRVDQSLPEDNLETESELTAQYRNASTYVQNLLQRDTSLSILDIKALEMKDVDIDAREIYVLIPSSVNEKKVSRTISREAADALADFIPLRYHFLTSQAPDMWRSPFLFYAGKMSS